MTPATFGVKLENRTHAPVDFDTAVASTITSHDAGYINKQLEKIVKFRRRKHYRKQQGHRQWFTDVKITGISA